MKIYAVLFGDGTHLIKKTDWNEIKPLVNKVKGTMCHGFKNLEDASRWVQTERARQLTRQVIGGGQMKKSEAMAKTINTPYWKRNLGRVVSDRIEMDQGFARNMR